ncbi:hypothetical protein PQR66_11510 [Paraburkholderia agricolaris]|uniref:Uncharacterized protein n=1 Tax=Paraburkholderia agricolaris TaxID=2152888 RepID=A0ABW8ZKA8_9BURK
MFAVYNGLGQRLLSLSHYRIKAVRIVARTNAGDEPSALIEVEVANDWRAYAGYLKLAGYRPTIEPATTADTTFHAKEESLKGLECGHCG